MRHLLVSSTSTPPSDKDKSTSSNKKDDQLDVENTASSGIKVSISQDSLLTRSPQHKQPQQESHKKTPKSNLSPTSNITRSLPSFTEKSTTSEKKSSRSRKDSQLTERLHRY